MPNKKKRSPEAEEKAKKAEKAQRKAATGYQHGIFLSRQGMPMAIESAVDMADHLRQAREVVHPFDCPPGLPKDLEYALTQSAA